MRSVTLEVVVVVDDGYTGEDVADIVDLAIQEKVFWDKSVKVIKEGAIDSAR